MVLRHPVLSRGLCLALFSGGAAFCCHAQTKGPPPEGESKPASASDSPAPAVGSNPVPDIPELRRKADAGDAEAQLALADLIFSGAVKDARPEQGAALLEKSAESGHAPAQVAFSQLLKFGGAGLKPDPERAKFLIQQAAEGGYAAAQTAYAALLMSQIDLKAREVSFEEPLRWFRLAADQGDPEAVCRLGMMRAVGQGTEADPVAAWKLISKAARVGHPLALNEAGICLQQGRGVEKDPTAAVGYFHAAADLGNTAAMVNLGSCYRSGNGVPRDLTKAATAFALAARANFGPAQFVFGEMLERGEGKPPDRVGACIQYWRAAANGIAAAKDRLESLKPALSEAQLKEVEKAVSKPAAPAKDSASGE